MCNSPETNEEILITQAGGIKKIQNDHNRPIIRKIKELEEQIFKLKMEIYELTKEF